MCIVVRQSCFFTIIVFGVSNTDLDIDSLRSAPESVVYEIDTVFAVPVGS